eukprot:CAMPEP_0168471676 /NCGR_PEP_ID=MMETSP0228-20121227/59406_1 /TAXON_ID=133427 /ORGANISM="Protoceratium reticulatum, Strain CCCM 535 (=CCMP 1889)" /LENGTH=90 /DNA_ID=CAMNT_0008487595 /DNA_START=65 /DNA_END=340 /DNA_ORIENTATION=-
MTMDWKKAAPSFSGRCAEVASTLGVIARLDTRGMLSFGSSASQSVAALRISFAFGLLPPMKPQALTTAAGGTPIASRSSCATRSSLSSTA